MAANHPLVDGHKRTARPAAATFLGCSGVDPAGVDQDRAYDLVVAVAAGRIGDPAAIGRAVRDL